MPIKGKRIDLVGAKYNRLTAKRFIRMEGHGESVWLWECDCGNQKEIKASSVKRENTKSCGCLKEELDKAKHPVVEIKNIVGQRFGRLVVVEFARKTKTRKYLWLCKCDCGNIVECRSDGLKSGHTQSCGCLHKEIISQNRKKPKGVAAFNKKYYDYKAKAQRVNREFNLTKEEFAKLIWGNCAYCGIPPSNYYKESDYNGGLRYNGIDRVDNDKGYTLDNCVSCCELCNRAKLKQSLPDFLLWVKSTYYYNFRPDIVPFTVTVVKS